MMPRPGIPTLSGARLAAALAAVVCLGAGTGAPAAAAAAAASGLPATAFVLFQSATGRDAMPASAVEIRGVAEAALDSALAGRGFAVVDQAVVDEMQRRRRIRDGRILAGGFLRDLADSTAAARLLVVRLTISPGEFRFTARSIDTATGMLAAAVFAAPAAWDDAGWRDALAVGLRRLAEAVDAPPRATAGSPLVILPVEATGLPRETAVQATIALLSTALAGTTRPIPDPGVVSGMLADAGHDPGRPGAEGLRSLGEALGSRLLISPTMITYDARPIGGQGLPGDEETTTARPTLPALAMQCRLIDPRTNDVLACADAFGDGRPGYGWFGVVGDRSPRTLLSELTRRLWRGVAAAMKEKPDEHPANLAPGAGAGDRGPDPAYDVSRPETRQRRRWIDAWLDGPRDRQR